MSNIIDLRIENFKRISVLHYAPPEGQPVIQVGGKNAAGKSTAIDSIAAVLGGAEFMPDCPIRKGEDSAFVEITIRIPGMDDLVARRTWTRKAEKDGTEKIVSTLILTGKDGGRYSSPQTVLDALYNSVCFDPLEFYRSKDQLSIVKKIVGLDFDMIDRKRKALYDDRTALNRDAKELTAQLAITPHHDGVPAEEQAMSAVVAEIGAAREFNLAREKVLAVPAALVEEGRRAKNELDKLDAEIGELEKKLADMRSRRDTQQAGIVTLRKQYEEAKAKADAHPPAKDISALSAKLDDLESINVKVRQNKAYTDLKVKLNEKTQKAEELTNQIAAIDTAKDKAMAEAKFPVAGLSFSESEVLYNKLPLSQASSAEQLRISVAIGLALNTKLKVLLIRDGSLLDSASKKIIYDMAKEAGAQVWQEVVAEPGPDGTYPSGIGLVIEDGTILNR